MVENMKTLPERVRAKFRFNGIHSHQYGPQANQISRNLEFAAVYSNTEENKKFWDATPSGKIEMQVVNAEACKLFEIGKEYYVDFIPAF